MTRTMQVESGISNAATDQPWLKRGWIRRGGAMMALVVAVLMALLGAAGTANASGSSYIYTQPGHPAAVATCWEACGATGRGIYPGNGTPAQMICYADEGSYTGNYTSTRFFVVTISGQPGEWWIHSSYVYYQTSVPHC